MEICNVLGKRLITYDFRKKLGLFSLVMCMLAWYMDVLNIVYDCPYCRIERTVIGLLGILLMLPHINGFVKYLSGTLGGFGFIIASLQNFMGWKAISEGSFVIANPWYIDPMILSGGAMALIALQITLIYAGKTPKN